jgi:hypothetical protein
MFGRVLGGKEHRKLKMPVGPRSRAKSYDSQPLRQGNCEPERRNVRVLSRRLPIPTRYLPGAGPGFLKDVRLPANQVGIFVLETAQYHGLTKADTRRIVKKTVAAVSDWRREPARLGSSRRVERSIGRQAPLNMKPETPPTVMPNSLRWGHATTPFLNRKCLQLRRLSAAAALNSLHDQRCISLEPDRHSGATTRRRPVLLVFPECPLGNSQWPSPRSRATVRG